MRSGLMRQQWQGCGGGDDGFLLLLAALWQSLAGLQQAVVGCGSGPPRRRPGPQERHRSLRSSSMPKRCGGGTGPVELAPCAATRGGSRREGPAPPPGGAAAASGVAVRIPCCA